MTFQASAFQNSAFQVDVASVGWSPGFRHGRKELEQKLKRQRSETFSRRWFDEYLKAEEAALERAEKTKSPKQREALEDAVNAASEAVAEAIDDGRDIEVLARALHAAAGASRITASIKLAGIVVELAKRAEQEALEDDDEAIMLLLH